MSTIVDVYATKEGTFLGKAHYVKDVTIASVTLPDPEHPEYTPCVIQEKKQRYLNLWEDVRRHSMDLSILSAFQVGRYSSILD